MDKSEVAQLVEQRPVKPPVDGSSPSLGANPDCYVCHGTGKELVIGDDHGHYGFERDCWLCIT